MTLPVTRTVAAILTELHHPLAIDEIVLPQQLDVGQVLVEVLYSGICGTQIGEMNGAKGVDKFLPHLLGHEGSGRVLSVGAGVSHVKPGDTVVMHWRKGVGIEARPPRYQWRNRDLNGGWVTTFNRHAVVSENRLTPVPPETDLETASLLGCAVTTGFGVVNRNAGVQIGESVLVIGAGGLGLSVIEGAALCGAHPIIGVDLHDEKLQLAQEIGASHTVNASRQDITEEVRKILGAGGIDVVVENTGIPRMIELSYAISQPRGRVVLVGVPKAGETISIYSLPLHFGKTLTGSHGGDSNPTIDIPRYLRLAESGKLKLSRLITDRCTLPCINESIRRIAAGKVTGRCIVNIAADGT